MNHGRKILIIRLIFTITIVLAVSGPALTQTSDPILNIEVSTHNSGITRIAMDTNYGNIVQWAESDPTAARSSGLVHSHLSRTVPSRTNCCRKKITAGVKEFEEE